MDDKVTIPKLRAMKESGERIAMLTAYDWPTALLLDRAGIDVLLVGDSVGNNILGYESTIPVTMDEMIHHTKAVRRGVKRALLIGDMPFLSYQVSAEQALANAGRFLKEGGADAVKLEGGAEMADIINLLVRRGIPVMGHIGLTPQRAAQLGGLKVQGRDEETAQKLLNDAKILEEAGVFSLVLEAVPWALAKLITVIGHRVGESVLLRTDDGHELRVRIEGVKLLEKPDLEELAKTLGHEDVAALRAKIRCDLEESRARQRERALKLKILDSIVARTPLELPARFVESLVAQELERLAERRLPEPSAEDVAKLKSAIEQRLKRELVMEAIKKQEGLALSDSDFEKLLEEEARQREMNPIKLRALLEREGQLQSFRDDLEDERVLQFLYEKAKIIPKES
jgi:3-methyl-2-oxobutanoate hydroxymethyltransferase